jgi:nitrate/nitrite-specific signal transduction histidine kinase
MRPWDTEKEAVIRETSRVRDELADYVAKLDQFVQRLQDVIPEDPHEEHAGD